MHGHAPLWWAPARRSLLYEATATLLARLLWCVVLLYRFTRSVVGGVVIGLVLVVLAYLAATVVLDRVVL